MLGIERKENILQGRENYMDGTKTGEGNNKASLRHLERMKGM